MVLGAFHEDGQIYLLVTGPRRNPPIHPAADVPREIAGIKPAPDRAAQDHGVVVIWSMSASEAALAEVAFGRWARTIRVTRMSVRWKFSIIIASESRISYF